jgi:hypothetical protein
MNTHKLEDQKYKLEASSPGWRISININSISLGLITKRLGIQELRELIKNPNQFEISIHK